jgi:hypothetical protein
MERLPILLNKTDYDFIVSRVEKLTSTTAAVWGKMDVAQMMAHCSNSLEQTLSGGGKKQMLIGVLIAWMFKKNYLDDQDIKRDSPTAPDFKIVEPKVFETEKARLLKNLRELQATPETKLDGIISPFFGKLTGYECARLHYKHTHHHLLQFGV